MTGTPGPGLPARTWPARTWLARAWVLLGVSSALYFLADNEADNDLWVHLASGRRILADGAVPRLDDLSYTAAGLPWIDHEWLTQIAFARLFDLAGSPALWLAKVAVAVCTAWLVWVPVRRHAASPWVRGAVMVLVLAAMARGYAVRPQMVTYFGVAALLAWLDRAAAAPRWSTWALVGLGFTLWANAHGAVIAGLGVLAAYAVLPDAAAGLPRRARLALPLLAVAAICVNPYGPALLAYIAAELRGPHPLTEWQPVRLADATLRPFVALLIAVVATLPFARLLRRRWWWAAIVAGLAVMALRSQRHTPLFAIVAAAPLADQAEAALAWMTARTRQRLSPAATLLVAAALAALAGLQLATLGARLARDGGRLVYLAEEYPVGAVRHLRAAGLRGNLALPLDWGGYVLWHTAPALRVSLDGRFATVYPPPVVTDGFAFFRGDAAPDAARLLDAYDTTLVLAPRGVPTAVDDRPGWRLLYTDQVAALWGRDGATAAAAAEAPRGWVPFP